MSRPFALVPSSPKHLARNAAPSEDELTTSVPVVAALSQAQWRDLYLEHFPLTAFGRSRFWRYGKGVWEACAEHVVRRELGRLMGDQAKAGLVRDVCRLLEA